MLFCDRSMQVYSLLSQTEGEKKGGSKEGGRRVRLMTRALGCYIRDLKKSLLKRNLK